MKRAGMIFLAAAGASGRDRWRRWRLRSRAGAQEARRVRGYVDCSTGHMKPSAMGPGGTMTENEKCEWMEGGFYLVCHSDFKSADGQRRGIGGDGIFRRRQSLHLPRVQQLRRVRRLKGTLDGDTWTWTSDEKMDGMTMKGRFTMKMTSATSYTFTSICRRMEPSGRP